MGDNEVKTLIAEGAEKLNTELKIGLNSSKLLKTGGYNNHTNKKKLKKLTREKNSLILNYNEAEFEADLGVA